MTDRFTGSFTMPPRVSAHMLRLSTDLRDCPVGKSFFWTREDGKEVRTGQVTSRIRDMRLAGDLDDSTTFVCKRAAQDDKIGVRIWKVTQ